MRWPSHPLVALVVEIALIAIPLDWAYGWAMGVVYRLDWLSGTGFALVAAAVACNAYRLYARHVARRAADELAPRRCGDLLRGWALGMALIAAFVAILAAAGLARLAPGGLPRAAGLPGVALLAGAFEELIARGILLRNLEAAFGGGAALGVSALVFAALHRNNPHATPLALVAVAIEGGLMLGAIYFATRSLWWPIGVHAAWNFTQSTVFGLADSGHAGDGLLRCAIHAPDWLGGGAFGIEASALSAALSAGVTAFFLARAHRRGALRMSFRKPD